MRVMIYTFSSTTPWWRYLASRLTFATQTILVSDLPEVDVYIIPSFYRHLERPDVAAAATSALGEDGCDQVIGRCRLLRYLDRALAMRMVGAMWRTIEELLDEYRPELFLCFVVDRYILDLFERALARRGVRYVGLAAGVLPDQVMFMAKGEYLPIREPSEAEVDRAVATLTETKFVPSYVGKTPFSFSRFMKLYTHFTARWLAFEGLMLWRKNPLDYRYLATRWAACGYRVRLRDWQVMKFFHADWQARLERAPFEKRVFVGLSVNPEAAIEYWVKAPSLIDYQATVERAARALGRAGYHVFVKDHPSQFGFRQVEFFRALARYDCVTFVPYEVPGQVMIESCAATFTWTGTVGLQAALAGRCAIIEAGAYYRVDGLFVVLDGLADVDALPERIAGFTPSLDLPAARRVLVRHILRASADGSHMSWRDFSALDPAAVAKTRTLIESLNAYLPVLASAPPKEERRGASATADG
jgi:hypothetical protein